ncbi:MAG: hypothetical protein RIC35_18905 [Marinoscillum sp.]
MIRLIIISVVFAINLEIFAQTPVKHFLQDSLKSYTAVAPPANAKGMIVFLPGFNQPIEDLLKETAFQNLAYIHGLATIFIPIGPKLFADRSVVKLLNEAINTAMAKYNIPKDKVIIGGFSAGGTIALRYSQFCIKYPDSYPMVPKAVFAVDSPVDLATLYEYCQREISTNYSQIGVTEARYAISIMERDFGGSPSGYPERYGELSPFNTEMEIGGNIAILKHLPVRSYHDVDVNWQIKNRRRSLMDMNVTPASEMINQLVMMGNEEAELIISIGTGVRSNGQKHPHSMSIIDDQELVIWALKKLKIPVNTNSNKSKTK